MPSQPVFPLDDQELASLFIGLEGLARDAGDDDKAAKIAAFISCGLTPAGFSDAFGPRRRGRKRDTQSVVIAARDECLVAIFVRLRDMGRRTVRAAHMDFRLRFSDYLAVRWLRDREQSSQPPESETGLDPLFWRLASLKTKRRVPTLGNLPERVCKIFPTL
jgi:hypothetical protein